MAKKEANLRRHMYVGDAARSQRITLLVDFLVQLVTNEYHSTYQGVVSREKA